MVTSQTIESGLKYDRFDWILIGIIFLMSVLYILVSGKRSFNFDEFQVLYASAALLRGKALYADHVGAHFPFVNILSSILIYVAGFKATTILIARYLIFCVNGITLFYIYRIGEFLWHRKTGMMAVVLTLATVMFMEKGIEIRHDVFNTMFNVIGAYYALRYLSEKKYLHLILSGLFCGLAVASTQKALIWSMGIISGVIFHFLRTKSFKAILTTVLSYMAMILLPLIICVAYLILANNESLLSAYKHSLIDIIIGFAPYTPTTYPFFHNRCDLLKKLFFQNPLFYAIGIGGIVWLAVFRLRKGAEMIVLISWTMIGVLFYLTVKRPFYQSFLPTIPPLAIVASGFLTWIGEKIKSAEIYKKAILSLLCIFFLLAWPCHFMLKAIYGESTMGNQIANMAFCLDSLKPDEKVMCLTQNQIFFDPVLTIEDKDCGKNMFVWDAQCLERKMIKEQCKIVIYDYRMCMLNDSIQKKINDNYIYTKIGYILIPGFRIPSKKSIEKFIWIDGYYYSPNSSLLLDGKRVNGKFIWLDQKTHTIRNLSDRPVMLVYLFKSEEVIKNNDLLDTYIHNML